MKKRLLVCLALVFTLALLAAACAPAGPTATPAPAASPTAEVVSVSSDEWKVEVKKAIWGGDTGSLPLADGQKQLLVFINLEYVGPEGDVTVPAYGVRDDQGRDLTIFASFGYGNEVPEGGENWISSYVSGSPATRHFTTGEAFRPLMFTFAGEEDAKEFTFFFGDLTADLAPVLEVK